MQARQLFWFGFFGIIVLLAILSVYAVLRGSAQLAKRLPEVDAFQVILSGQPTYISPEDAQQLNPMIQGELDSAREAASTEIQVTIETEIDRAFSMTLEKVADFMDWYYSLQGEYTRLGMAVTGNIGDLLVEQLKARVFEPGLLESRLEGAFECFNHQVAVAGQQTSVRLHKRLADFIGQREIPDDPERHTIKVERSLNLERLFADRFAVSASDISQHVLSASLATGVGVAVTKGLAAAVVKKVVAKVLGKSSFKAAAVLLGKLAVKGGVKSAGAGAAATTGALACSWGGPIGIAVCGTIAGGITWVLVDKGFVELEEALNREQFEEEIRSAILQERDALKAQLKTAYTDTISSYYGSISKALSEALDIRPEKVPGEGFVPANAVGQ